MLPVLGNASCGCDDVTRREFLQAIVQRLCLGIAAIGLAVSVGDSPIWSDDQVVKPADRQFWAFRTPARTQPPSVRNADQARTPSDRFVLTKL